MNWTVDILDETVAAEIEALSPDLQARFVHIGDLIRQFGPHQLSDRHLRHLDGKLWEMRMKGKDNIARAIYVAAIGKRLVVLHIFVKKTQKTPRREIRLAQERAKEAGLL